MVPPRGLMVAGVYLNPFYVALAFMYLKAESEEVTV